MNPTRSGHPVNGNNFLKTRQKIIIVAGVLLTFYGFTSLGYELWRRATGITNELRWQWIALAVGMLSAGLVLVQTLNPLKALEVAYLMYRSRFHGGQRWYDPPPDTAPTQLPREKWPTPPPRKPREPKP